MAKKDLNGTPSYDDTEFKLVLTGIQMKVMLNAMNVCVKTLGVEAHNVSTLAIQLDVECKKQFDHQVELHKKKGA